MDDPTIYYIYDKNKKYIDDCQQLTTGSSSSSSSFPLQQEQGETSTTFNPTPEQLSIYEKINKKNDTHVISTVALLGQAGTGKTTCLQQFVGSKKKFIYVTTQNNLLQNAKMTLKLKDDQLITLCSLMMKMFDINFYEHCKLVSNIIAHWNIAENYDWFFNELPINRLFCYSFLQNGYDGGGYSGGDNVKSLILCIDEFSMICNNVLHLLTECFRRIANDSFHITIILCGDCHQIQPIFTMNDKDDDDDDDNNDNTDNDVAPNTRYSSKYISKNCQNILSTIKDKYIFYKQLRNPNCEYLNFLNSILTSDTWQWDIQKYFKKLYKSNRQISINYPFDEIKLFIKENQTNDDNSNYEKLEKFTSSNAALFNNNNFFSWCNIDAHFMNLSYFLSVYNQFNEEMKMLNDEAEIKEFTSFRPRLSPIYFHVNDKLYPGL